MALFDHDVRNDDAYEIYERARELGQRDIPPAMTWELAQFIRAFRHRCETQDDAKQLLLDQFTEWQRDAETGEPKKDEKNRRVPAVVYVRNDDGSPRFKLDDQGNTTNEREVAHGKIQLTDMIAYDRAKRDFDRETAPIKVPHLSWIQLEAKVGKLPANIVAALFEFFKDSPDAANGSAKSATAAGGGKKTARAARADSSD